jgi:hypothetical protein
MNEYRTELRIFGLLVIALISTVILYVGFSAANVTGDIYGLKISLAGPAAFFVAIILVFRLTGLFTVGLRQQQVSDRSVESLKKREIDNQLDIIEIESRRLSRRKQELESAKTALENNADLDAVFQAGGFRPVSRPIN